MAMITTAEAQTRLKKKHDWWHQEGTMNETYNCGATPDNSDSVMLAQAKAIAADWERRTKDGYIYHWTVSNSVTACYDLLCTSNDRRTKFNFHLPFSRR